MSSQTDRKEEFLNSMIPGGFTLAFRNGFAPVTILPPQKTQFITEPEMLPDGKSLIINGKTTWAAAYREADKRA